ncbi:flagellar motor protein MotB [Pseudoneobacillus sp. C159]
MAKRRRHKKHEDEHIDESWLIPYADLLTLLLALFIVLFSMRAEDENKANAMLQSLYKAFNSVSIFESNSGTLPNNSGLTGTDIPLENKPDPEEKEPPIDKDEKQEKPPMTEDEKQLQDLLAKLQKYIDQNQLNASISLTDMKEGIKITLKESISFDSGSDHLKPGFIPILDRISGLLKTVDHSIIIEGHTDNQPISTSNFPSNWELSGARAASVVHFFQSKNIDPKRMSYTGYGEYQPVKPNNSAENRAANRRVNIIILRK